ncbi:MAG: hypothetical protein U1E17_16485 [Geminicoccaceae bacterium]
MQKVFRASIHALEETLDPRSRGVREGGHLLFAARQRDLYGIGGPAQIARDVSHKFLRTACARACSTMPT